MPRQSDSMEEGTIIAWLKRDGDDVAAGDDLVEIETDKASVVYAAEADGVLEVTATEGSTVALGHPIARLLGTETDGDAATNATGGERGDVAQPLPGIGAEPVAAAPGSLPRRRRPRAPATTATTTSRRRDPQRGCRRRPAIAASHSRAYRP